MRRFVIVDVSVRIVFPAVVLGSLWLLLAGHNQPGGGFVGGIVAGAGIALRYVAGGLDEVRGMLRVQPWTVLAPLLVGGDILEAASVNDDLPVLGQVKLTSALAFDAGVYLVVVGLVLMMFESFGDDVVPPADGDGAAR